MALDGRIKQMDDKVVLQLGVLCSVDRAAAGLKREECDHVHAVVDAINDKTDGFYDNVLRDGAPEPRRKTNAPWTRTRILNPATLTAAKAGKQGVLWHLDLANVERPCVIRTHDLGIADPNGWECLGRAKGAEARGCSLTVEELLG